MFVTFLLSSFVWRILWDSVLLLFIITLSFSTLSFSSPSELYSSSMSELNIGYYLLWLQKPSIHLSRGFPKLGLLHHLIRLYFSSFSEFVLWVFSLHVSIFFYVSASPTVFLIPKLLLYIHFFQMKTYKYTMVHFSSDSPHFSFVPLLREPFSVLFSDLKCNRTITTVTIFEAKCCKNYFTIFYTKNWKSSFDIGIAILFRNSKYIFGEF